MPDCVKTRERCNRKSVISVSLRHFLSDPRPRVTRPAPAGRVTCARGSLGISEEETETQDCEITFQGSDSSVVLFLEAGDSLLVFCNHLPRISLP